MKDILKQLYPDDYESVARGISELKENYASALQGSNPKPLSQEDCILITYGDALGREGEMPLETLAGFADSYLGQSLSAVHLLPCFPYTSDDGFSVTDYYEIDPELGNW